MVPSMTILQTPENKQLAFYWLVTALRKLLLLMYAGKRATLKIKLEELTEKGIIGLTAHNNSVNRKARSSLISNDLV